MKRILLTLSLLFFLPNILGSQSIRTQIEKEPGKQIYKVDLGENADEVIIGDDKSADFKTKVTFTKWNKEAKLSISYPAISGTPTLGADKVLIVSNGKEGFYFNRHSNELFKFGLILYETPKNTDTWNFEIQDNNEFNYLYQEPWLNVEEFIKDGETWVRNLDTGKDFRPLNVQGSYAVYHKNKANHIIGQANYMTGKVGHIYRPRLLDADDNFLGWVDLYIGNGIYKLYISSISQIVLNNAKLPLKFNDWFGSQNVGGSATWVAGNDSAAIQLSQLSPGGTNILNSISVYGNDDVAGALVKYALYSNKTGTLPNLRLVVDVSGWAPGTSVGWKTNTVDMNYELAASTQYWGAIGAITENFNFYYDGDSSYKEIQDYTAVLPATWTRADETNTNRLYSVYATYTPSGEAPADEAQVIFIN